MENHYANLHLDLDASQTQIKEAYKKMSLVCHPDKHSDNKIAEKMGEEMFKKIKNSYEILTNPVTKLAFDNDLKLEQAVLFNNQKRKNANTVLNITYQTNSAIEASNIFTTFDSVLDSCSNSNTGVIWWFRLDGSYFVVVKNNISTGQLSDLFHKYFPQKRHLVMQVNVSTYTGFLEREYAKLMEDLVKNTMHFINFAAAN
jgi:DnaJ-class molecular chaperone